MTKNIIIALLAALCIGLFIYGRVQHTEALRQRAMTEDIMKRASEAQRQIQEQMMLMRRMQEASQAEHTRLLAEEAKRQSEKSKAKK